MLRTATTLGAMVLLSACSTQPRDREACALLDTAMKEGQFAEAWYLRAGEVLAWCGVPHARERAEFKACHARRFNDNSVECPFPPDLPRPETTKPEAS